MQWQFLHSICEFKSTFYSKSTSFLFSAHYLENSKNPLESDLLQRIFDEYKVPKRLEYVTYRKPHIFKAISQGFVKSLGNLLGQLVIFNALFKPSATYITGRCVSLDNVHLFDAIDSGPVTQLLETVNDLVSVQVSHYSACNQQRWHRFKRCSSILFQWYDKVRIFVYFPYSLTKEEKRSFFIFRLLRKCKRTSRALLPICIDLELIKVLQNVVLSKQDILLLFWVKILFCTFYEYF